MFLLAEHAPSAAMTNPTLLLPQYHKYLNGASVPFSRRTRRNSELCLVVMVFLSLTFFSFGAVFYLPELKATYGGTINTVYKQIQNAGPELLLPARGNARHDGVLEDPHAAYDKKVLSAKIDEDYLDKRKVLERPDTDMAAIKRNINNSNFNSAASIVDHVSDTSQSYDNSVLSQRRNKVKEVSVVYFVLYLQLHRLAAFMFIKFIKSTTGIIIDVNIKHGCF